MKPHPMSGDGPNSWWKFADELTGSEPDEIGERIERTV